MARVKFIQDFDYKPTRQSTIGYLAGWEGTVKRECAKQATAAGKAIWAGKDAEAQRDGETEISE
ncbi:hypothetical protein [Agrobacterium vitis]|uniref:hypothetical protein n=1 Tax=Agrobacterium vitis TaxID=373 RepID=UPI00157306E6|nr:hypothetical protein [Agrobacterium vitis]NSZ52975.1 hypothetical protein [Agrobacterium vitis]NTA31734.1 hypothetical protein [Agrobacterium vitis]